VTKRIKKVQFLLYYVSTKLLSNGDLQEMPARN